MRPQPLAFVRQYVGVVLAALVPVAVTAFLSIPVNLGGHPGELRSAQATVDLHMT